MNIKKWLDNNTDTLKEQCVAITGATGGIGKELCLYLAKLGANLILMDRNFERSHDFGEKLRLKYGVDVKYITVDLSDFKSVRSATEQLTDKNPDIFIHNAGAYSIPRYITDIGYDNVFQINFISPYYIISKILPLISKKKGKIVVVGSIAHNYSKADIKDIDFRNRKKASLVYGNAKRYLMFSLYELFVREHEDLLSITHPGITFTNITAHYPKLIFAIIKHPMKIIFMNPKIACLSILKGVFDSCKYCECIGPRFFGIWGKPSKKTLKTCDKTEREFIGKTAEEIYNELKERTFKK